jgi:PAS domain S-box-containing protein
VDYFLHDELRLMDAVASSMSFALEALALEEETRLANELLHRQQSELRALFDLVPAMLCIKNTQNGFLRVNQQLAETVGKSVEEIEGKSAFELFPNQAAAYFADDLEVIRTGQAKLGIVEQIHGSPSGDLWVQTDKVPYRDEQGNVIGLIAMVRDITESKQAELRLNFLNRVYAVLSGINTLIVRVTGLDELFSEACRIAVERGGFRVAYVAIVDRQANCLRPVAIAGAESDFVGEVQERMSLREDEPLGHGPPVMVIPVSDSRTCTQNVELSRRSVFP